VLGLLGIEDKAHENAAVGILVVLARRLRTLPGKIPQAAASLTRSAREDGVQLSGAGFTASLWSPSTCCPQAALSIVASARCSIVRITAAGDSVIIAADKACALGSKRHPRENTGARWPEEHFYGE
jgi:hypothetical protein